MAVPGVMSSQSLGVCEGTELGEEAWKGVLGSVSPPFPGHLKSDRMWKNWTPVCTSFPGTHPHRLQEGGCTGESATGEGGGEVRSSSDSWYNHTPKAHVHTQPRITPHKTQRAGLPLPPGPHVVATTSCHSKKREGGLPGTSSLLAWMAQEKLKLGGQRRFNSQACHFLGCDPRAGQFSIWEREILITTWKGVARRLVSGHLLPGPLSQPHPRWQSPSSSQS